MAKRWQARVAVQPTAGEEFYHEFTFRARTRTDAKEKALKIAGRRFQGCGIRYVCADPME